MKPLTESQRALVADPANLRTARTVARRMCARCGGRYRAELRSAALYGLVMAARTFDPSRGVPFIIHARNRCHGECQEFLRSLRPRGFRRSSTSPVIQEISDFVEDGVTVGDSLAADELPVGWEIESLDEIDALTAGLPPREREVIRLYFGHAFTAPLKEIGRRFGFGMAWASITLSKARNRMAST